MKVRAQILFTLFIALLVIAFRLWQLEGGWSHPESCGFLIHYNDPACPSFAARIFHPLANDWGCYQARELSYGIDFLDARFIGCCIRRGMPHFLSLTFPLLLLLTVALQQFFLRRLLPKLSPLPGMLLSLIFVSAAAAEQSFNFFRSSKPVAALAVTVALFCALGVLREEKKKLWLTAMTGGLLLGALCDRQGVFAAGAFAGAGALGVLLSDLFPFCRLADSRRKGLLHISLAALGVTAAETLYNLLLAPALIRAARGYAPSFEYQQLSPGGILNAGDGFYFLLDNLGYSFFRFNGLWPLAVGGLLFFGTVFFLLRQWKTGKSGPELPLAVFAVSGALFGCSALMTSRHTLLLHPDVIHSGYFLPMLAAVLFCAALLLETYPRSRKTATLLLGAAFLCNLLIALPAPVKADHLSWHRATTPVTKELLRHPEQPLPECPLPFMSEELIRFFRGEPSAAVDYAKARP